MSERDKNIGVIIRRNKELENLLRKVVNIDNKQVDYLTLIDMAHQKGYINDSTKNQLHQVRKVRNNVAHDVYHQLPEINQFKTKTNAIKHQLESILSSRKRPKKQNKNKNTNASQDNSIRIATIIGVLVLLAMAIYFFPKLTITLLIILAIIIFISYKY